MATGGPADHPHGSNVSRLDCIASMASTCHHRARPWRHGKKLVEYRANLTVAADP